MIRYNDSALGEFMNENKNWYTYAPNTNPWAIEHGLTHEIDVLDGKRSAIVKKTVVIVAVDENGDGTPVIEKWKLNKHNIFKRG